MKTKRITVDERTLNTLTFIRDQRRTREGRPQLAVGDVVRDLTLHALGIDKRVETIAQRNVRKRHR